MHACSVYTCKHTNTYTHTYTSIHQRSHIHSIHACSLSTPPYTHIHLHHISSTHTPHHVHSHTPTSPHTHILHTYHFPCRPDSNDGTSLKLPPPPHLGQRVQSVCPVIAGLTIFQIYIYAYMYINLHVHVCILIHIHTYMYTCESKPGNRGSDNLIYQKYIRPYLKMNIYRKTTKIPDNK